MTKAPSAYLRILLWLIALHSFTVAVLLILLGEECMQFFGFPAGNAFFQVQGGIFHIVMVVAYLIAATKLSSSRLLIIFIVTAKSIAATYLLLYYFLVMPIMVVLLSGIADGLMGLAVLLLWRQTIYFRNRGGGDA
jgi:hypothetical protein